jgi:hypothetical protein
MHRLLSIPLCSFNQEESSVRGKFKGTKKSGLLVQMAVRLAMAISVSAVFGLGAALAEAEKSLPLLWVSHSHRVSVADLAGFDTAVVESGVKLPKERVPKTQVRLAFFNPAKVIPSQKPLPKDLPVIASLDGSLKLDLTSEAALNYATGEMLAQCLASGVDGVVVDVSAVSEEQVDGVLARIRTAQPRMTLYVKNPSPALNMEPVRAGVFAEFACADADRMLTGWNHKGQGPQPMAVALADSRCSTEVADQIVKSIQERGALGVVMSEKGDGFMLAPLRERSRRALILYGWDPAEAEKPVLPPTDTMTAELFQAPLEHLGLEAEYLDVGGQNARSYAAGYGLVVLDSELDIPSAREREFLELLLEFKAARVPILFTGSLPFKRLDSLEVLRAEFGLRGSLQEVAHARNPEIVTVDESLMNYEAPVVARGTGLWDMRAPADAHVLVAQRCKDGDDVAIVSTSAFLCSWGGMWLDPFVLLRGSQDNYFFFGDPYRILGELIAKGGTLPVLDSTTRNGKRLFYSHVDGDGFGSLSQFKGHPFCAELVRDRVFKAFPLPVTVSIVAAELQGLAQGIKPEWRPRLEELARSIYTLPHVRAASHSFAHPYQWDATDPNPGIYTEPFMTLQKEVPYKQVDLRREIMGSIDYINEELLPEGKRVELMLWTGNCRPGIEALRVVDEAGVLNMNGGQTIVSRHYPGIAGVASRVMPWGDYLQIHASNQNEFMYANGWSGPFFGGFADVIDTFERTESPRRLKPVNVYYHFYSATSLSALRALEKVHQWCMTQSLHPISAYEYAQIAKDVNEARIFELGPKQWRISTGGHARTVRVPVSAGRPDLDRSRGVTGWTVHEKEVYIHTDGSQVVDLALGEGTDEAPAPGNTRLRLMSATEKVTFSQLDRWKALFVVNPLAMRPVNVVFSGVPANSSCDLTVNDSSSNLTANSQGQLQLQLPPGAHVVLDAQRTRYALLR